MNADHSKDYSYLDQIRVNEGAEKCKSTLNTLLKKDIRRTVTLLNDHRLMFPSLYILHEPILQQRIQRSLNMRNMTALELINQIKGSNGAEPSSRQNSVYSVLKWILETGFREVILEDDYEQILDMAVSILIKNYKDIDILPMVVDLLFKRNRDGRNIHELVWALFCFHDPKILKLIAEYLRSSDPKDAKLAGELLNIDKIGIPPTIYDGEGRYKGYLHWLEENQPYLYFTEESYQYTSNPMFCCVDLERKYLQKSASSYEKHSLSSLDNEESECMAAFKQLGAEEQKILSEYSQRICRKSVPAWKAWLQEPIMEQIKAVKSRSEAGQ